MQEQMFVVMAGSLLKGMGAVVVVNEVAAPIVVQERRHADGCYAESLALHMPEDAQGFSVKGDYIVLFGDVTRGFKAVGPFVAEDDAEVYAESTDDEHAGDPLLDGACYAVVGVKLVWSPTENVLDGRKAHLAWEARRSEHENECDVEGPLADLARECGADMKAWHDGWFERSDEWRDEIGHTG